MLLVIEIELASFGGRLQVNGEIGNFTNGSFEIKEARDESLFFVVKKHHFSS